jgi:hypothetical protein
MSAIQVSPVSGKSDLAAFIALPKRLYRGQPGYTPPLDMERSEALTPKTNPFFDHAEVQLFLARRDGKVVGRISAQIDKLHQQKYADKTGHFGFLDAEDDPAIFAALMEAAEAWLKQRGMVRAVGPLSFTTNEEIGVLVEGFDARPMLLMPFHPPYNAPHIERRGYLKVKDVLSYNLDRDDYRPLGSKKMLDRAVRETGVVVRTLNEKRFNEEVRTVIDIFNDAWADNWGMVPVHREGNGRRRQGPEAADRPQDGGDRRARGRSGRHDDLPAEPAGGGARSRRQALSLRHRQAALPAEDQQCPLRPHPADGHPAQASRHGARCHPATFDVRKAASPFPGARDEQPGDVLDPGRQHGDAPRTRRPRGQGL